VRGQSLTTTDADGTDTATAHHKRRREANVRIAALPSLRRAGCNYLDYLRRKQHKYRLFMFNVVLIVILRHFNKYIPTLDFKIANIHNVYSLGNSCNV